MIEWLKSLFQPAEKRTGSFNTLKVDMHSHLIPGIDDGVQTLEESLTLIKMLKAMGYEKCITTPHIMSEGYQNNPEVITTGLAHVRNFLKDHEIDFPVDAAAEYLVDHQFMDKIEKGDLLLINGKYILMELPFMNRPPNLDEVIFELNLRRLKPILAHPERYMYMHDSGLKQYEDLKNKEVLFQLNITSLTGYYSPAMEKMSKQLVQAGMVDFLGTDIHNEQHLQNLQKSLQDSYVVHLLESTSFKNAELS